MSLLRECWVKLKEMLVDNQLWHVFVEIEMKLLPIISGIYFKGASKHLLTPAIAFFVFQV